MGDFLSWLQSQLIGCARVARAGVPVRADGGGERYGSATTHLALVLHDRLSDAAQLAQFGAIVRGVVGAPDAAAATIKDLVTRVPGFADANLFINPNSLSELPQILSSAYFGRTADEFFRAGEGSDYQIFLLRIQNNPQFDHVHRLLRHHRVDTCWWGTFCSSHLEHYLRFGTCSGSKFYISRRWT